MSESVSDKSKQWSDSGPIKSNIPIYHCSVFCVTLHSSLPWFLDLWTVSALRDLKDFPQRTQGMESPVMWLDSMWSLIWFQVPCFPQTLQSLALPFPGTVCSLNNIIAFTFSSKVSSFFVWSVKATIAVSDSTCLKSVSVDSSCFMGLWALWIDVFWGFDLINLLLYFSGKVSASGSFPFRRFSWSSSAKVRKKSRFPWKTLASPQ